MIIRSGSLPRRDGLKTESLGLEQPSEIRCTPFLYSHLNHHHVTVTMMVEDKHYDDQAGSGEPGTAAG